MDYNKLIVETHASVKAIEERLKSLPCKDHAASINAVNVKASIAHKRIYKLKIWVLITMLGGVGALFIAFLKAPQLREVCYNILHLLYSVLA